MVAVAIGAGACKSGVEESMTTSVDEDSSSSSSPGTTSVEAGDDDDDDDGASVSSDSDESGAPPQTTSGDEGSTGESTASADVDEGESSSAQQESTGEPVDCDALDEDACDGARACMSISASRFVPTTGSNYCIAEPEFVACADVADCKEGMFVRCDADDEPWFLGSSCAPDGWTECDEPGNGHAGEC